MLGRGWVGSAVAKACEAYEKAEEREEWWIGEMVRFVAGLDTNDDVLVGSDYQQGGPSVRIGLTDELRALLKTIAEQEVANVKAARVKAFEALRAATAETL